MVSTPSWKYGFPVSREQRSKRNASSVTRQEVDDDPDALPVNSISPQESIYNVHTPNVLHKYLAISSACKTPSSISSERDEHTDMKDGNRVRFANGFKTRNILGLFSYKNKDWNQS